MASPALSRPRKDVLPLPDLCDIPVLYEDEEEEEFGMGDSNVHTTSNLILYVGTSAHLALRTNLQVYCNMNLYYLDGPPHKKSGSLPYISPDVMVVEAFQRLPEDIKSYKIGRDGPAPIQAMEVLSERSGQQRDLGEKMVVYAKLRVEEYIVVDQTGKFLPERLILKRLQPNGAYKDEQDADGGVTSRLGFRIVIDTDGRLRVIDATTGHRYVRPDEAEQKIRELQAQLDRLRPKPKKRKKK